MLFASFKCSSFSRFVIFFRILKVLDAKGGGKGKRLNAKFGSLKNLVEAEKILQNYFQEKNEKNEKNVEKED